MSKQFFTPLLLVMLVLILVASLAAGQSPQRPHSMFTVTQATLDRIEQNKPKNVDGFVIPDAGIDRAVDLMLRYGKRSSVDPKWTRYDIQDARLDQSVALWWANQDADFIYDLFVVDNPRAMVPNYVAGSPMVEQGNVSSMAWSFSRPNQWLDRATGIWFGPGLQVENPGTGELVTITDDGSGWVAPEGFPQAGETFYFVAAWRSNAMEKMIRVPYATELAGSAPPGGGAMQQLALAYSRTGDERYARQAAIMLNRLAEVYRYWNGVIARLDWRTYPRRAYFTDHGFEFLVIEMALRTYDLIFDYLLENGDDIAAYFHTRGDADYNADGLVNGDDIRFNIEVNMFSYMYEFLDRDKPVRALPGTMAMMGVILQNPDIVKEAKEGPYGYDARLTNLTYRDGRGYEDSSGYGSGPNLRVILRAFEWLHGWDHPEVQTEPWDLVNEPHTWISEIQKWHNMEKGVTSTGRRYGIGDTGNSRGPVTQGRIRTNLVSNVYHDIGMTVLRSGNNPSTRKDLLLYHGLTGGSHSHRGQLKIKPFAFGYDLSADMGYPANLQAPKRSELSNNTISHATVLVDQKPQNTISVGNLNYFVEGTLAAVADASSADAYSQTSPDAGGTYRRTVALVPVTADDHFIFDVFRVAGGRTHDYAYHGLSGEDGSRFELELAPGVERVPQNGGSLAGENVPYLQPTGTGYSYLKDVVRSRTGDTWSATWRATPNMGLRLTMLGDPDTEVITALGEGEGVVGNSPFDTYVIVRRQSEHTRSDQFVGVFEPFRNNRFVVEEVTALRLLRGGEGQAFAPVGVHVRTNAGKDYLLLSTHAPDHEAVFAFGDAEVAITGHFGIVMIEGDAIRGELVDGTQLRFNEQSIVSEGSITGEIVSVNPYSGEVVVRSDRPLPVGNIPGGQTIVFHNDSYIRNATYTVEHVESLSDDRYELRFTTPYHIIGRGVVDRVSQGPFGSQHTVHTSTSIPKLNAQPNLFAGKRITGTLDVQVGDGTVVTTVRRAGEDYAEINVRGKSPLAMTPGEPFYILDIAPGDRFRLIDSASGMLSPEGVLELSIVRPDTGFGLPEIVAQVNELGTGRPVQGASVHTTIGETPVSFVETAPGEYRAAVPEGTTVGTYHIDVTVEKSGITVAPMAIEVEVAAPWTIDAPNQVEVHAGAPFVLSASVRVHTQIGEVAEVAASQTILPQIYVVWDGQRVPLEYSADGTTAHVELPGTGREQSVELIAIDDSGVAYRHVYNVTVTGGSIVALDDEVRVVQGQPVVVRVQFLAADGSVMIGGPQSPNATAIAGFIFSAFEHEPGESVAEASLRLNRGQHTVVVRAPGFGMIRIPVVVE